jgi:HlyD family secretion protein
MDRPIDPTYRRRQRFKRGILSLMGGALAAWVFVCLPGWVRPALRRSHIRTARVEWGPVEAGITASGTVVPQFEQVISSPISSRVVAVLERPGAVLAKGQPIVELDLSQARLEVEKLGERVALTFNQQAQLEKEMEKRLNDLETQRRIKELELESLRERAAQYGELLEVGAVSRQQVREAELNQTRAALELEKIEKDMRTLQEATNTELEGLALEARILEKERQEALRRLERARLGADREGVLTWVLSEEGAAVSEGQVVARIADLSSFRIDAGVSSMHAERLYAGLPAQIPLSQDTVLSGRIAHILPAVKSGELQLEVQLDEPSCRLLRPQMRVEVRLIAQRREHVLRLEKGLFAPGGEGVLEVFVVRGEQARRTPIRLGVAGYEYCEIEGGVEEGDEVILSDMRDYEHMMEIRLH